MVGAVVVSREGARSCKQRAPVGRALEAVAGHR